ncbi:MAG: ATP synthase F1 subunit delta [Ruminococcaceae bacterium]|nr:ATP synthase F1 subunit delta [Oscillospiraceae bacterium]
MTEISKEYGTALFMLACEKNSREDYALGIERLKDAFEENPEYLDFLASLSIPASEKIAAIERAFSGIVPEDVVSYVKLLCERGRIRCFIDSATEYKRLLDESKRVSVAKVTSATELLEKEKVALKNKLEKISKTSVEMEYLIDKSLIGGVIVELDGKIIDGSLRSRLQDIKEVING